MHKEFNESYNSFTFIFELDLPFNWPIKHCEFNNMRILIYLILITINHTKKKKENLKFKIKILFRFPHILSQFKLSTFNSVVTVINF